jgi:hypothetical protein
MFRDKRSRGTSHNLVSDDFDNAARRRIHFYGPDAGGQIGPRSARVTSPMVR